MLSNIQVLTGNSTRQIEGRARQSRRPVLTLLVTPPDAEKLALAPRKEKIVLALRNPLDTAATESTGAHMSNLVGAESGAGHGAGAGGPAHHATPPPARPRRAVVVQKGKTQTKSSSLEAVLRSRRECRASCGRRHGLLAVVW